MAYKHIIPVLVGALIFGFAASALAERPAAPDSKTPDRLRFERAANEVRTANVKRGFAQAGARIGLNYRRLLTSVGAPGGDRKQYPEAPRLQGRLPPAPSTQHIRPRY
jgi:hypothetical protein